MILVMLRHRKNQGARRLLHLVGSDPACHAAAAARPTHRAH
jgi:hypothetical protein